MNYQLIDTGDGRKLEKFGEFIVDRPDPQIIWKKGLSESEWKKADAKYNNGWEKINLPDKWQLEHAGVKFILKLTPFKHLGVFPEQSFQWEYITKRINNAKKNVSLLNLFAYTGIASIFAAKAGAKVTHVDASKPAITWANENKELNGGDHLPIRWIIDDAIKFLTREIKRGIKYDAIIMDPPVYGHGPEGEIWDFNKNMPILLDLVKKVLSGNPLFVIINSYAVSTSSVTLANALETNITDIKGQIDHGELTLKEEERGLKLTTGIWARYAF